MFFQKTTTTTAKRTLKGGASGWCTGTNGKNRAASTSCHMFCVSRNCGYCQIGSCMIPGVLYCSFLPLCFIIYHEVFFLSRQVKSRTVVGLQPHKVVYPNGSELLPFKKRMPKYTYHIHSWARPFLLWIHVKHYSMPFRARLIVWFGIRQVLITYLHPSLPWRWFQNPRLKYTYIYFT